MNVRFSYFIASVHHSRTPEPQQYNKEATMKTYSFKAIVEPDEDAQGQPAWFAHCPALESLGAAASGRTPDEALSNVNDIVRMIVQEFIEAGKALPEGPADSVEVFEISREEPRIAVTV
jgi:predicted RNase H-like HicB family nuclease